jgi:hypothetical protein
MLLKRDVDVDSFDGCPAGASTRPLFGSTSALFVG